MVFSLSLLMLLFSSLDRQCFVFGGWSQEQGYLNDLLSISVARDQVFKDSLNMTPVIASGTAPSPRAGHAACAVDNFMAVFGGASGAEGHLADLHLLDTQTMDWVLITPESASPPGRSRHAMEWIPPIQCLAIFGGADEERDFGDFWLFHLPSRKWSQPVLQGPAPSPRWGLSMNYTRGRLFVFGGQHTIQVASADAGAAAVVRHEGGESGASEGGGGVGGSVPAGAPGGPIAPLSPAALSLAQMYMLDIATMDWRVVVPFNGLMPITRAGHTMNVIGDRYLVMFGGGHDSFTMLNDVNVFDSLSFEWSPLVASAGASLAPRWAHAAVAIDGQLIVYGGANGTVAFGDVVLVAVDLLMARHMAERMGGQLTLESVSASPVASADDVQHSARGKDAVHQWLRTLGLADYAPVFAEENITMRLLPFLTEEHLEEIGVDSLAARLTMCMAIKSLNAGNPFLAGDNIASLAHSVQELARSVELMYSHGVGNNAVGSAGNVSMPVSPVPIAAALNAASGNFSAPGSEALRPSGERGANESRRSSNSK